MIHVDVVDVLFFDHAVYLWNGGRKHSNTPMKQKTERMPMTVIRNEKNENRLGFSWGFVVPLFDANDRDFLGFRCGCGCDSVRVSHFVC